MVTTEPRTRLSPRIFRLPVEKIRDGYYSDAYVVHAKTLLEEDGHHPDVLVSGGFDAEPLARFEEAGVPVDAYGVGSSLIRGANDFTADVVMVEGRPCAKVGRALQPSPRLSKVE
mgnify:CR=1 FL=1